MKEKQSEERRMFERVPLRISLRYLDCQTNKWSLVKTHDASVRGLGLLVKNGLAVSSPLEMWLPLANQGESYYTKGKVVWSTEIAPEKYRIGVCLDHLDLAGMSHFVKKHEK